MQTNLLLTPKTAQEIDQRVEKILKDLGNPAPPLQLPQVRALLRLDLGYYSSSDHSWLREKIHQMKVAGQQVIEQPSTILTVVRRLGLKAILLPENRRILLDDNVPKPKHRWNESHEIIHDILPWHDGMAHGDPESHLKLGCHEKIEAEANYGAGQLLFLGSEFKTVVRSSPCNFALIRDLHTAYGNTLTTTLWRVVEHALDAAFGLVTVHPRQSTGRPNLDIRYFIRSPKFSAQFSKADPAGIFASVRAQCFGRRGPIGSGEFLLPNDRDEMCDFCFETFFNGHDALTLASPVAALKV